MSYQPLPPLGQTTKSASLPVTLASDTGTLPVSVSGAATETTLGTRLSESDFDTKTGSLTETAPATDTASSGLNGRLQRIAQRLTSLITAIGSPFQAGGSIGNTSFASTQSGTWTVQPGNTANTTAWKVDGSAVTQPVSGTVTANAGSGTMAVSLASVPSHAVTNAGTFAVQATLQTGSNTIGALSANQSVNVSQMNGVATTMGNGVSGTGVQRVTMASDSTGTLAGVTTVTTLSGGGVAHDGADSGNPHKMGARATNVDIAAVSATNDRTDLVATLTGKLITHPWSNPENFVSGAITSAMTGTTSTSLIAAPAAGLRNYITQITVSNSHATVGTDVIIQDGSGGTTLYTIPAAAVYGGASVSFPVPLRQPTTATALYCANVTTGASTKVSASGYKAA